MRVTSAVQRKERKKSILEMAKGMRGRKSKCVTIAKDHVDKKLMNSYKSRRLIKRDMRSLWIMRINAAARAEGISYSKLMHQLRQKANPLNRKALAELAVSEPSLFAALVVNQASAILV